jgi:hypothetical protein
LKAFSFIYLNSKESRPKIIFFYDHKWKNLMESKHTW